MKKNRRRRPIRAAIRALCLLLLAFSLFHVVGAYLPFSHRPELEDAAAVEALADAMQRDIDTPDRAALLGTHADALDERIRLLNRAEREIVITSYDLRDGESTRDVACVALERADAGVRVRLLVDGIAGLISVSPNPLFKALEAHPNIEIRFYNPPRLLDPRHDMGRMHDKYLIVDDMAFILGGRNSFDAFIGEYLDGPRKDDREALVYNGDHGHAGAQSAVSVLRDYFASVWDGGDCAAFPGGSLNKARGDRLLDELRTRYDALRDGRPELFQPVDYAARTLPAQGVWLVSNPTTVYAKQPAVFSTLCAMMDRAKRGIVIHSPYAVLSREMAGRLSGIAESTPVTLMVNAPEISHNIVATGDYLYHRGDVIAAVDTLLEYAGDNYHHGKALLIDDALSVIGCYNLDLRSTYVDTELMLVIRGKAFADALRANMDALHAACRRVIDENTVELPEGLDVPRMSLFKRLAMRAAGGIMQLVRNLI